MKVFLLMAALILSFWSVNAQSFFKPLPKGSTASRAFAMNDSVTVIVAPSVQNALRPVVNFAAYSEPGHILMAGAGVAYEHLQYDQSVEKWKSVWSVSAILFGGAGINATDPDKPAFVTYGLLGGFFNNLINIGPVYNTGTKKLGVAVAIGINLNN